MLMAVKPPRCKECRRRLEQSRPGQIVHEECAESYVQRLRTKKAEADRKRDRQQTRERKEAIKGLPALHREAQAAFNAWVRERDAHQPCISCGAPPPDLGELHAGRDAGHYRSVGSASHLRYHQDNVHAQCVKCNQWSAGKAVDYRIGLIARIGLERVEALEADNRPRKWDRDEIRCIRDTYRRALKELKTTKENGQ